MISELSVKTCAIPVRETCDNNFPYSSVGMCRSDGYWYVVYTDTTTEEFYRLYHSRESYQDGVCSWEHELDRRRFSKCSPEEVKYPHMNKRDYAGILDIRIFCYKAYWEDYPLRCVSRFVIFQDRETGEIYKVSSEHKELYSENDMRLRDYYWDEIVDYTHNIVDGGANEVVIPLDEWLFMQSMNLRPWLETAKGRNDGFPLVDIDDNMTNRAIGRCHGALVIVSQEKRSKILNI